MHIYNTLIIGAIEVQIATMAKRDRSRVEEVYVCGFVPSYALPNKMPWSLDPFLFLLLQKLKTALLMVRFVLANLHNYSYLYFICMYRD